MTVSLSELSEKLGVSASTIRRYAKTNLGKTSSRGKAMILSDDEVQKIAAHFSHTKAEKEQVNSGEKVVRQNLSNFSNNDANFDKLYHELAEAQLKAAVLEERCKGLEAQILLLERQLDRTHEELEREQSKQGFISRFFSGIKMLTSKSSVEP